MKLKLLNPISMAVLILTWVALISISSTAPVEGEVMLKRSVELVKSITPITGAQLGISVDLCTDANYGQCIPNQHLIGNECYSIRGLSLSSIRFGGSTSCNLYYLDNCDDHSSAVKVTQAEPDLGALDWNDRTASIRCYKPNILDTHTDIAIYPAEPDSSLAVRDTAAPSLGVAMDLCEDSYHRDCLLNQHLDGNRCYQVVMSGLSSIYFSGHMRCTLFSRPGCDVTNDDGFIILMEKVDDLKTEKFNDRTQSIACYRYD